MWEMNDFLTIYSPTEQESVEPVTDQTLQELTQAESNYRKLQFAGFVTADAISKVISSSTNHSFRESCFGHLQIRKQQSIKQVIQKMFLKSVCNQGLKRKECENGKDAERSETSSGSSFPANLVKDDSYDQGCSSNHIKKRRLSKDVQEDSPCQGTTMEIQDSDYFSQSPRNYKDCIPYEERNVNDEQLTSGTAIPDVEERSCDKEDERWLKELCNLSNW